MLAGESLLQPLHAFSPHRRQPVLHVELQQGLRMRAVQKGGQIAEKEQRRASCAAPGRSRSS